VLAMSFFITFDRKPWPINIILSLDMVIEKISLSFVGSIATHNSHTNSIEPILISVSSSTINSFILFLAEDNLFAYIFESNSKYTK
jgi:hypothetical protein